MGVKQTSTKCDAASTPGNKNVVRFKLLVLTIDEQLLGHPQTVMTPTPLEIKMFFFFLRFLRLLLITK